GEFRMMSNLGPAVARWALLTMLGLLVVEVVLAWRFGHYSAAPLYADEPPRRSLLAFVLPGLLLVCMGALGMALAHAAWTGDFLGFLPDAMRARTESSLGIPPPAAGEGS